jgi:hypothetical protein
LARSFFSEHRPAEPAIVAAEAGFPTAQFMLGMAHLRGNGVQQDNRAAYHWLRLATLNSARVVEESRGAIDEATSRLEAKDIQELEKQISAETEERSKAKLKPGHEGSPAEVLFHTKAAS